MDPLQSALRGNANLASLEGLNPAFREGLGKLFAANPNLTITSGYRSPEKQAALYRDALNKYGSEEAARKWVAPPGKSQHNHGNAVDIGFADDAARKWAHDNAAQFGLSFPLAHEPWHIELASARSAPSVGQSMAPAQPVPTQPANVPAQETGVPALPTQTGPQFDPAALMLVANGLRKALGGQAPELYRGVMA